MKRSKHINLDIMRKGAGRLFAMRPLAVAITAATLSACGGEEKVVIVKTVEECSAKSQMTLLECEAAYEQAQAEAERTGPKYNSRNSCESEFGVNQCRQSSGGSFMPFMTGFMISQLLSNRNDRGYYNPVYHYSNPRSSYSNRIMTADGTIVGKPGQSSYTVNKSSLKQKPTVTRTVSRGGFGSVASAKSSWGGGRSRGGWGG